MDFVDYKLNVLAETKSESKLNSPSLHSGKFSTDSRYENVRRFSNSSALISDKSRDFMDRSAGKTIDQLYASCEEKIKISTENESKPPSIKILRGEAEVKPHFQEIANENEVSTRRKQKIQFISIEGNIGAGKSTLMRDICGYIEEYQLNLDNHIIFLREPVDLWEGVKDENGKNMLELFYENPQKYAFEFQTMAYTFQTKLIDETLEKNPQCRIIVSERSFDAGHNIFTKMLHNDGYISYIQYEIYKILLKTRMESTYIPHSGIPDKVIYLDIPYTTCKNRIKVRGRGGEENISLEYLEKCERYYKEWLNDIITQENRRVVLINDNKCIDSIIQHIF